MSAKKQTYNRPLHKHRSDLQRLTRRFMSGLLRSLFFVNKPTRYSKAGFVLPTTVLLLLMVTLTVGAVSYRTFSRTEQTISYRNQQVIDSLAAPAIDRAKAKIEYLFTKDPLVADKRPPSSEDLIQAMSPRQDDTDDPYTITGANGGETRLDINGSGIESDGFTGKDPAWTFRAPDETQIIYSIIVDDVDDNGTPDDNSDDVGLNDSNTQEKADKFVVRNGPIDTRKPTSRCSVARLSGNGWQISGPRLAKNIQVNVLAIRGDGPSKTVSASEYQQVRTASRGNRWGAWWRYDMEIAPGDALRWNGAIHTEGSLVTNKKFFAYMVSSKDSCIYDEDASVIEVSGLLDNGFQGQLVSGTVGKTGTAPFIDDTGKFHTDSTAKDGPNYSANIEKLYADDSSNQPKDSVIPESDGDPADILQDPIAIFTKDDFVHNDDSTWNRFADWSTTSGVTRVINDESNAARPFLDDGYRADDRYGPKFAYNRDNTFFKIQGDEITDDADKHKSGDKISDNTLLTENIPDTESFGLDGYWERSAATQGLRVVVGQRLELGNTFGWKANADPLYPPNSSFTDMFRGQTVKGTAETLQMRTLRDNLAAVQSMAVYNAADSTTNGQYPLACIASTVHPGNLETLKNSRTFERNSDGTVKADFFTGHGTNGLEFDPPPQTDFSESTGVIAPHWVNALQNLAYFAGDLNGGAPSFPAVQGKEGEANVVVHPYPYMSMWGDFSVLRRLFTDTTFAYSPATKYDELSIADKSTIHTAACTLGMLANNIKAIEDAYAAIPTNGFNALGVDVAGLMDGNTSNGEIGSDPTDNLCRGSNLNGTSGCPPTTYDPDYYAQFTTEEWINALENNPGGNTAVLENARILSLRQQSQRDRTLGFIPAGTAVGLPGSGTGYSASNGTYTYPTSGGGGNVFRGETFNVGCDPASFTTSGGNSTKAQLGLSVAFCSIKQGPKYPSLYYLFPVVDHSQSGTDDHTQPTSGEDYTSQPYLMDATDGINRDVTYKEISDTELASLALAPRDPSASTTSWKSPKVALSPTSSVNDFDFTGPTSTADAAYNASANTDPGDVEKNLSQNIIAVKNSSDSNYTYYQTAFLDKAIMDARELMTVRLMDLDIDLLTDTTRNTIGGKAWIPEDSGIFYAFREDAVREDAIVRPFDSTHADADAAWSTCSNMTDLTTNAACYMSINPTSTTHDPPLNVDTGISPKPVDLFADPARRPYGFRLVNGESFHRTKTEDPSAGMTFVTDNTAYIRGDFNIHAKKSELDLEANLLEEFKGANNLLGTDFATESNESQARKIFYRRSVLDEEFANPEKDNWRPVEIFADAVTILSDVFLDGWIEDYYVTESPKAVDSERGKPTKNSSFLNAHRPWFTNFRTVAGVDIPDTTQIDASTTERWKHEVDGDISTPVLVDRNSKTFRKKKQSDGDDTFYEFPLGSGGQNISFYKKFSQMLFRLMQTQQPQPSVSDPVRVNALLISGVVPARDEQGNGGLYNFPRLLEFWGDSQLVISGGFFQLNFSSQATAPWDQDAWEPGDPSHSHPSNDNAEIGNTGNQITSTFYYNPPTRVWGYDVGFQYTSAAPIARRFVRLDRPRSEFYRELPVDDPYIQNLCSQSRGGC